MTRHVLPEAVRARRRLGVLLAAAVGGPVLWGCDSGGASNDSATASSSVQSAVRAKPATGAAFRDATDELGLHFEHYNGATDETFLAEIMGSGGALLDYDNDGDLDVYLVQGARINDSATLTGSAELSRPGSRLFRNRLVPDGRTGFDDVTDSAGLVMTSYGMGVATGDIDNDGDLDLYQANLGPDALYLNNGDGTFADASAMLDASVDGWSSSASFVDVDLDGWLDVVVVRYVDMSRSNARACFSAAGRRDYCSPDVYRPMADALLRNDGRGGLSSAVDWQQPAGAPSTGLGVVAADFDGDGLPDLYVANDKRANQLWLNRGNGQFEDFALFNGCSVNAGGKAEASMGIAAADMDFDGDEDLFITHLKGETNTLYLNNGDGVFFDATNASGLSGPSIPSTAFGTGWFDYDSDGDLDLFTANGAVQAEPAQVDVEPFPYVQRNQLFANSGSGYVDASAAAGFSDEVPRVSRGASFGDIDNDGDVDILVTNNGGPARVLLNEAAQGRWVGVRLRDDTGNRDGIGAQVSVTLADGRTLRRRVDTGGSYSSASDVRLHLGLGATDATSVDVNVIWPGGTQERFLALPVGQLSVLVRGTGAVRQADGQ